MAAAKSQALTPAAKADGGLRISRLTGLKKRQQIELAGRYMFIWVVIAAIAVSFCLATGQYLFSKWLYNNKVLSAKYTASDTLGKNITAATELKKQVDALVANNDLASVKTDPNDTTTKSVLDALPITGDSAALATSLQQAILNKSGVTIQSITVPAESGTAQGTASTPQEMQFSFVVTGSYDKIKNMVHDIERTIRPIKISDISMSGSDANLQASIDAVTYYQLAKTVNATQETVK